MSSFTDDWAMGLDYGPVDWASHFHSVWKSRPESRRVYKFVKEPDDSLKCLICLDVAQDPWQHDRCGKVFCRSCLDKLDSNASCPNCRRAKPRYFRDSRGKRDIAALKLICNNVNRGCEWEGPLGDLDDHLNKRCQFALVPCPNQCTIIIEDILRKDLKAHLNECPNRHCMCEYCGREGTFTFITQVHDMLCEKKIVPCTNAVCNVRLERRKLEAHVANDCEHTVVSCKYESIGCDVKMKRRYMREHEEDDTVHLHKALGAIAELKNNSESVTFKVENFQSPKKSLESFTSSPFYFDRYQMLFKIAVMLDGLSIKAKILNRKSLKNSHLPTVTMTLLNQLTDDKHYTRTLPSTSYLEGEGQICSYETTFIHLSMLEHDQDANVQYLKSDTLYFRVSVQVPISKPWQVCSPNTR